MEGAKKRQTIRYFIACLKSFQRPIQKISTGLETPPAIVSKQSKRNTILLLFSCFFFFLSMNNHHCCGKFKIATFNRDLLSRYLLIILKVGRKQAASQDQHTDTGTCWVFESKFTTIIIFIIIVIIIIIIIIIIY